jgi:hypothetical protein
MKVILLYILQVVNITVLLIPETAPFIALVEMMRVKLVKVTNKKNIVRKWQQKKKPKNNKRLLKLQCLK